MAATVPDGWVDRVAADHSMRLTAMLLTKGEPVLALPNLLTSGSGAQAPTITIDVTSASVRAAAMEFVDEAGVLAPGRSSALLPAGNEIALTAWIDDGQGGWWSVPAGVYGITVAETDDTTVSSAFGPVVPVSGQDRAQVFSVSKLSDTFQTLPGTPLAAATYQILHGQVPWIADTAYQLEDFGVRLPAQILTIDTDPWATVTGWWASVGLRLRLDRTGNIVGDAGTPSQTAVRVWTPGPGALLGVKLHYDGTQSYNGVTVVGSYPGNIPVRATRWDEDSSSTTWRYGAFGERPAPSITNSVAATVDQCDAAAAAALPRVLGLSRTLALDLLPDAALDEWDTVEVDQPAAGVSGLWQMRQISFTADGSQQMTASAVPLGVAIAGGP